MGRWRLFFWEPVVSPHKLALVRAAQNKEQVLSCTYIAHEPLTADRLAQGWSVGDIQDVDLLIAPSDSLIDSIVADAADAHSIHLFSGMRGPRVIAVGLAAALRHNAQFGIMSEPRASEGAAGIARLGHSWITERELRTQADLVLAIGRNGPPWFYRTGYPKDRVFPFAYFLPTPPPPLSHVSSYPSSTTLAYLGRLTVEKGIGVVLDALPLLPSTVNVQIAGIGPEASLVATAADNADGRITYAGAVPMVRVHAFLSEVDILIQPSQNSNDGWAAVVSEALLAGCAVVATSKVGASVLLEDPLRGYIMNDLTPNSLVTGVHRLITDRALDQESRVARQDWARSRLTGEAGADYLLAILEHRFRGGPRPTAPYLS